MLINFSYASSGYQKWRFFVHITTLNAPYVHLRLDLILELCMTFPISLAGQLQNKKGHKILHNKKGFYTKLVLVDG